jgi:Leucine-rich repeat (LRR) protein
LQINLPGCGVNDQAAVRLATTLAGTDISTLNLTFNQIGTTKPDLLRHSHSSHRTLSQNAGQAILLRDHSSRVRYILLSVCTLASGDIGTRAISKCLRHVPRLRELTLSSNLITDIGATALAQALADPSSGLVLLDLSGNMIGNDGAVLLAAMLEENASLVEVCLDSNYIGLGGKDALAEALANNKSVRAAAQCRPPQDRSHQQAQADKQAFVLLFNTGRTGIRQPGRQRAVGSAAQV